MPSVIQNRLASVSTPFARAKWMRKSWNARFAKSSISSRLRLSNSSIYCARSIERLPTTDTSVASTILMPLPGNGRIRRTRSNKLPLSFKFYAHRNTNQANTRLQSCRYKSGGLWKERNRHRGKGDAGIDGDPGKIRAEKAAGGR